MGIRKSKATIHQSSNSTTRQPSRFDALTTEEEILNQHIRRRKRFVTDIRRVGEANCPNSIEAEHLGGYRADDERMFVTANVAIHETLAKTGRPVPSFLIAGPREKLAHHPECVRAAIVTAGGLAPGINCVIHAIVNRHWDTYGLAAADGVVYGVGDSFLGLSREQPDMQELNPQQTEAWLDMGGSKLGNRRFRELEPDELANTIARNLEQNEINILYVIGGNGTLSIAHKIARFARQVSVIGIPKTMDNDVLWVSQSIGFATAVEQAEGLINTLHAEAESTCRIGIIELFGAESGFVAANAALASGHVDLVLIPEPLKDLSEQALPEALDGLISDLGDRITHERRKTSHGLIVIAEGVGELLQQRNVGLHGTPAVTKEEFIPTLKKLLKFKWRDKGGRPIDVFVNRPRHNIRSVPPNARDRSYCERLGALAVDTALAGYTDCMVSQWLDKYVLVPLSMVEGKQKCISDSSIFWKQVVNSTGQQDVSRK